MQQINPWNESGGAHRCVICKGTKMLCGKDRCPILVKVYATQKTIPLIDSLELEGSSPPAIFVGKFNYPKVYVGPLIPPAHGDTTMMDLPESWTGRTVEEIVGFRSQLVRGKYRVDVRDVESPNRIVRHTRELVLAKESIETEAFFTKKPAGRIFLSDEVQPFGPSAPIEKFDVGSYHTDHHIEKAYSDTDLKANQAVIRLYGKETPVSKIQKAFSAGVFGIGKNRKFVPTRWSITAVDDALGKHLLETTKASPLINEYRVYEAVDFDNRWIILMMPRPWSYELIEAWYPKTLWNPEGNEVEIFSSSEGYNGRKTYAEIGGCYYAARLAVNERLTAERRQAAVVILRESHAGYIMPLGVWVVREGVRQALKKEPMKFATLSEAFGYASAKLDIPVKTWIKHSTVLKNSMYQKRMIDYGL